MRTGTFGLPRKHTVGSVVKGDMVVCCAGKGDWKIIGTGSATTDYYVDIEKKFLAEGCFPDRFDFVSTHLPKFKELNLMQIIDRLSFVKNLAYWAVFFRNGIVKISRSDWELLQQSISNGTSVSKG
jgi:hypothetical protein